jgi:anti-sigma regulatory factor (Ser/Thr protein kinase)
MTFQPRPTVTPQSGRTGTVKTTGNHPGGSELHLGVGPAFHTGPPSLRPQPAWSYLELAALPTAVSCARLHAKQVLWEWGLTDLSEVGELIVSELVTNAVQITAKEELSTPIRLWLSKNGVRLFIEVWDADRTPPTPKALEANGLPPREEEGGRGLFLVATLSQRWGWYPERAFGGKVVWAEMGSE